MAMPILLIAHDCTRCLDSPEWPRLCVRYGGPLDVRTVHMLRGHQKISKFPRSNALTLKSNLYGAFARMRTAHGAQHFGYMPRTWILPEQVCIHN